MKELADSFSVSKAKEKSFINWRDKLSSEHSRIESLEEIADRYREDQETKKVERVFSYFKETFHTIPS